MLPDTSLHEARKVAQRICQKVHAVRFPDALANLQVSISIGVASFPVWMLEQRKSCLNRLIRPSTGQKQMAGIK
jgi:GGDEF domain-containing protein